MQAHLSLPAALIGLLLAACSPAENDDDGMPSFADPAEMVGGWYHRHEHETWISKGARAEVIEQVLQRIESADGARWDPQLVDTIEADGPGNWVFEWSEVGQTAMDRAARSVPDEAFQAYRAALAYFTIASWPHLGKAADSKALTKARTAYLSAGRLLANPVQHVSFTVDAADAVGTRGYLHLPAGSGPFPLLVYTYGSDVTKEDGLGFFTDELQQRGIALLSVDLPGIGEAAHLSLLEGSDQVLLAAAAYAADIAEIDSRNIFLAGVSFGGNASARAFLTHAEGTIAGVVSMCGPLHAPFVAPAEVYDAMPALTMDGVKARLGISGASSAELAEIAPGLSLQRQGLFTDRRISTPLLILTTNRDPVAPLQDLAQFEAMASTVQTIVLDEIGHCPSRHLRQPVVARWVADRIRS